MTNDPDFTEDEIQRYGRQIILPEIGGAGQARLRGASVLAVGAGGLGSPLLLYLAAAGIGRVGVADGDTLDLSNLNRQVLHRVCDIGRPKAESARDAIAALNPLIRTEVTAVRVTPDNAEALLAPYDVICDASDNPSTRLLLAETARRLGKPLISAAVRGFEGQLSTFTPYRRDADGHPLPCYRCLYPQPPDAAANCAEAGIMGAVAGVMGAMQALETIKGVARIGRSLAGRLLIWDGLEARFRVVALPRDPGCPGCGSGRT